ncbi:hypothetical protein [Yinghuangia sp. YIM S09857]|uniref:hypothetical protein n=1 Tax=Yinghuangia sp. YIM S09857 TaxID=3436929 RepID=UPI003F539623
MATEASEPVSDRPGIPESLIDQIGQERAQELMARAVREAVERQHAAGLATAHGEGDGRVFLLYPDGTKVYLDEDGRPM